MIKAGIIGTGPKNLSAMFTALSKVRGPLEISQPL